MYKIVTIMLFLSKQVRSFSTSRLVRKNFSNMKMNIDKIQPKNNLIHDDKLLIHYINFAIQDIKNLNNKKLSYRIGNFIWDKQIIKSYNMSEKDFKTIANYEVNMYFPNKIKSNKSNVIIQLSIHAFLFMNIFIQHFFFFFFFVF